MIDDLSDRCKREAEYFERMAEHYAQLAAHCEQFADQWRHAAPDWDVAHGGEHTPDRHSYSEIVSSNGHSRTLA